MSVVVRRSWASWPGTRILHRSQPGLGNNALGAFLSTDKKACPTRVVALLALLLSATLTRAAEPATKPDTSKVPGVVIDHSPASTKKYIGSPSIAVLPNGDYVASHDEFGPGSAYHDAAVTRVFRSKDKGQTWEPAAKIDGAFWSTLFVHRGALYLLGTHHEYGELLIRRSDDGGKTWTSPKDKTTGLLAGGKWHTAPVPVIEHDGRLWRGVEDAMGEGGWGKMFRARMMSVPADADLLSADNWTITEPLGRDPAWFGGKFNAWLEGNAVVTPDGKVVDILRVDCPPDFGVAAIVPVQADRKTLRFDPETGFVRLPAGDKKFTIRWDPKSKRYWTLGNVILPKHLSKKPGDVRNAIALLSSPDLRTWTTHTILLYQPDVQKTGFQYLDWLFDGDDLIVASRTAADDGLGGAHRTHDANFLTFHRFKAFRDLSEKDSVVPEKPLTQSPGQ